MQDPVDYPVPDDSSHSLEGPITYAALLDRHEARQPITEEMIRAATQNLEAAHQFPFAAPPETIDPDMALRTRNAPVLSRLLNVIR